MRLHRVESGEYHGFGGLKSGQRLGGRIVNIHDGVADFRVGDGLDVGEHKANLACRKFLARHGFGRLIAQALDLEGFAVGMETDFLSHAQAAVHHAQQRDDAAVGIEPGIEQQRAQGGFGITRGRRHQVHHGFQHFMEREPGVAWV